MTKRSAAAQAGLAFLICLGSAGCGKPELPFADVEGVVKLRNQPLGDLHVRFIPEPEGANVHAPESEAFTDENGSYRLSCPSLKRDGAVVGRHRVLLFDRKASHDDGVRKGTPPRLPLPFGELGKSSLKYEVKPGTQTIDIVLP